MIDYKDPIPPVINFFSLRGVNVFGNTFPTNAKLPALLVRNSGGTDYTRIQLIYRADKDYEAMGGLIGAMNLLERYASSIAGLQVVWCEREANPMPDVDQDTQKPEAWCYMRLEHLEA
ncbi:hypothetical protein J1P26_21805 [Neobacillus sp. MM2021_6]|uniref:hypothetical protein n=1 Tax=Bacillaceae TaxID=186817 RepID=UPI0014088182|nr:MULTISPECIES: hypothetical protein [Bacillaceae]MBO0962342.1 hypothetical protein [Neobacillus sp. MM2021_6]NHC20825.1 hypothetical protein [Bacillus sp. MM2020_4]